MKKNDNESKQKTYFIYVRSTGEKVPVTKAQHDAFYKEADRIRHTEQDHGRCMYPYRKPIRGRRKNKCQRWQKCTRPSKNSAMLPLLFRMPLTG